MITKKTSLLCFRSLYTGNCFTCFFTFCATKGFIQALCQTSIFAFKIWISMTNGYRTMACFEEMCKLIYQFYGKLKLLKMGYSPPWAMPKHWSEVTLYTEVQNVCKWSLAHHCMIKIIWKILASNIFSKSNIYLVFLKPPMRIRACLCLKRAVHLTAITFCIKFYT